MEKRRTVISALLLAVFLPALLSSVLHRHPEADRHIEECTACVHHLPHPGHLSALEGGISDCVLCHFLGLPYILASLAAMLRPTPLMTVRYAWIRKSPAAAPSYRRTSRAPPVLRFA
ncbi:MAG: hypothetical protein IJ652_03990 [Bacteroidales bacterium]|nr:hypothetical protein [Bacteroidales bacterium]